jgi:hypothetical protein
MREIIVPTLRPIIKQLYCLKVLIFMRDNLIFPEVVSTKVTDALLENKMIQK